MRNNIKIKVIKSNVNTPDIINLTSLHDFNYMPKDERRFDTVREFRDYVNDPKNGNNLIKVRNDIRYLSTDIVQEIEFNFRSTTTTHTVITKRGLVFDGGSLPMKLQFLVNNVSRLGYANHDEDYKYETLFKQLRKERTDFDTMVMASFTKDDHYSRLIADKRLTANHKYRKVMLLSRIGVYYAVRLFGFLSFNKHRRYY